MPEPTYRIADILRQKADQYELTIFHRDAIAWLEGRLFDKRGQPYLKCLASDRDRRAYPEEIVRQLYVKKLMDGYGYPKERIEVERPVFFGSGMGKKRADIVVTHKDDPDAAYIIVEVKKPNAEMDGEAVGWLPGIPNLNEAFIHVQGLRRPWDYARLWWYMRRQPRCLAVKSVLVLPEYWGRGVAVLLFAEMGRRAVARGYTWLDLSITSEDNPHTPILARHMGARIYKRYRVYRLGIGESGEHHHAW